LYGDELEISTSVDLGETTHDVVLGLEYMRFTDEFSILIEPASALHLPSGATFPLAFPPIPANTGDAQSDIFSAYIHDQVDLNDEWLLAAGGRVDYLDFEDDDRDTSRTDTEFSPFGGLVFQACEAASLYVNGGLGFAPPSTQVRGPRGAPETSSQVEAGVKLQGENWFCQASVYQLERDDIAIPESTGLFSRNGSQESVGAEIELQGELAPGLRVLLAYGYLDSELDSFAEFMGPFLVDQSGNTAPFAPEHTLRVWGSLDLSEQLGVGLGVRALSDQYIAPDNGFEIESYATVDAAISYTTEDWTLSVHVENLTGEDYATRGTGNTSIIPADDLSAMATLGITL
jgi:outer membrane receptor protein involved in Fe transport